MNSEQLVYLFGNLGGIGAFAYVVYQQLRGISTDIRTMRESFVRMEERGNRIQRPTHPRPQTEPGL
jgi:hypothetical protein